MKTKHTLRSFLALAGSALLTISYSHAADGTWDTNANGDWTNPLNWVGNTDYAAGADFTATFGDFINADRVINLDAPITIGNITASDATHNYTISGANILTLDVASGVPVINVTPSGRTLTISSQIAGIVGLQKNGAGTLALSNASNNYTGTTTITGGALVVNANALPGGIATAGGTSALTFNGGVLGLSDGIFTRSLGTAGTVTAANFTGAGGWAAYVANRTVNLGGASAQIAWVTVDTGFNGQTLILSNATATHSVDFQNGIDLGTAARTVQVDNGTADVDAELSGVITGGTGGALTKTGAGTLSLSNANTYSGISTVTLGVLLLNHATALPGGISSTGGTSNLSFNGTGAQNITVLGLGIGPFERPLGANTVPGAVTFTNNGGWAAYGADRIVNLGGSGAAITWATANTGFNAKTLILGAPGATHTVTLANPLNLTTSTRTVFAGNGAALVDGILSGAITSTTGGLTKQGAGNLALSGINTYAGKTTVEGGFPGPGQLIFQGKQAVSTGTTFETTQSSGATAQLTFLDDSAGSINLNNSWVFKSNTTGTTQTTVFVGNNHTANGGSGSSSTQTNSTIVLGGYSSAPSNLGSAGDRLDIKGANGYKLQFASLAFPDISTKAAASTFTMTMNPTTAPLIVAGGVTPFASTTLNSTPVLNLDGTATANEIQGAIADPSNVGTSNPLRLTKNNSSTWTLSGTNGYTGTTTVSAGTLLVNGSLNVASAVTVTAGTLGGTGTISGTVTIGNGTGSADAILAPGASIDSLDTGNLTFNSDGSYAVELNGSLVTTDVTTVTGAVAIHAATTLTVNVAGTLSGSQQYVIVSNDGADPVTGTFFNLTQGATVGNFGGTNLKISYIGGDGNDIVLYTESTGASAYDTWKAANAPGSNPDDDTDGDGVPNAVEFVLGGTSTTNDLGKLPLTATDATNMTFTFQRKQSSIDPKTSLAIEVGTDLVTWNTAPSPYTVSDVPVAGPPVAVVDNMDGTHTITLTVTKAPDTKKFARLKVVITP